MVESTEAEEVFKVDWHKSRRVRIIQAQVNKDMQISEKAVSSKQPS
jgi:hypothetical protein